MEEFKSKLRLIFLPFLYIAFFVLVFITFLHWLFFIKFHTFNLDEDVINFFVPAIFPGLPILLFLRPRIILLKLNTSGRRNPVGLYIMLAWFTIGIPTVIAQEFIITETGKLTRLDNIYQIKNVQATKYYTVKTFYVNKNFVHVKFKFDVSGKNNESFNMKIYACVPVFDHLFPDTNRITAIRESTDPHTLVLINDTLSTLSYLKKLPADSIRYMNHINPSFVMSKYGDAGKFGAILVITRGYKKHVKIPPLKIEPVAWLSVKFAKTISNNLDRQEKQSLYRQFANQSDSDFKHLPLDKFVYLDRIQYNSKELKYYVDAINSKNDVIGNDPIILSPQFGNFADRNGNHLQWIFGSLTIGSFIFLVALCFSKLKSEALEIDIKNHQEHEWLSALTWIKTLFIPKNGHWGTQILIAANLLVFLIMVFAGLGFISFDTSELLKWGANYRPAILNHEYWRLVTSIFIHGGLLHLFANMYGLFLAGIFLEPVVGTSKYLSAYIISGIAASLASIWWHYDTISVGASGAIFGLCGVFFALLTVNVFPQVVKRSFLIMTSVFIIYNLLYGLSGGVDNAAHIGGLFSGLVIGYILYPSVKLKMADNKLGIDRENFKAESLEE